jgi:hypothetical protein
MAKEFPIGLNIQAEFFKAEVLKGTGAKGKWKAFKIVHKNGKGKDNSSYTGQMIFAPNFDDKAKNEKVSKAIYYSLLEAARLMGADVSELEATDNLELFFYDLKDLLTREKERGSLKPYYIKTAKNGEYVNALGDRPWISTEPNLEFSERELSNGAVDLSTKDNSVKNSKEPIQPTETLSGLSALDGDDDLPF